ncbi:hypothetical protein BCR37DRAFT_386259 [Protomyces lactucae-debilis]|uniref:Uncharacterized protein n=1 Tax=Protomyces lactucae-debilis TaxID=2754530 RepID=A0A1Y2FLQ8_PROLT|nr:uncharacterized protein BCR37DRAFT_386259 [Protomyces lactucae-debilis]ORY84903.1 hypothetical protein BCR37DRAFT_386259 [Protomyces lactucae-debilis]
MTAMFSKLAGVRGSLTRHTPSTARMKYFIFLLCSSLLLIGNFAPSAASPAAAAAAEPGRTAGERQGTPTTAQNTNRGQKRIGDDQGAGPSKARKQNQKSAPTSTAEDTCYGLKLRVFRLCAQERQDYRDFLKKKNLRPTAEGCVISRVCVNTRVLDVEPACPSSLCPPTERPDETNYQCPCEATLIAFRIRHAKPWNMPAVEKYFDFRRKLGVGPANCIRCHRVFVAERMTKPHWVLKEAVWDPLVDCKQPPNSCKCSYAGGKDGTGGRCTADLFNKTPLRTPLSMFYVDLNKEPAQDSAAAATGSSQELASDLEFTQTFALSDLNQNGMCINPTIDQPGFCSRRS